MKLELYSENRAVENPEMRRYGVRTARAHLINSTLETFLKGNEKCDSALVAPLFSKF